MPKKRPVHALYKLEGRDSQTVCGHYVNPGPNPLPVELSWSKVTCRSCLSSSRRGAVTEPEKYEEIINIEPRVRR